MWIHKECGQEVFDRHEFYMKLDANMETVWNLASAESVASQYECGTCQDRVLADECQWRDED